MATGSEEIRVPISLPVDTNAGQAAQSVDQLQLKIQQSRDAFKDASAAMRGLRGTSDEVKAAKDQLKAKIDAEKQAISDATVALLKQGTSYDKVAAQAKDALKEQKDGSDATAQAVSLLGGRAGELQGKWDSLSKLLKGADGISIAKVAALGLAAAVVAATVAVVGGAIALARWALESAGAAQSQRLLREAVTSSAADAQRLGNQVDLLGSKVPLAKDKINEMAVALRKSGIQGQTLVDTLNASAQATSALGDAGGAKIEEIIKRGAVTGRTAVSRQELRGTGIDYDAFAKNLAAGTSKSTDAVKTALMQGQVSVGAAAQALRKTVEDKFGGINLEKMFSVEGISETWHKLASGLTKGIDLKPLATGLQQILKLFDTNTVTGKAMHDIVVGIGNGAVQAFTSAIPAIHGFIQGLVIGALQVQIAFLKTRNSIKNAFGDPEVLKNVDWTKTALEGAKIAVEALAIAAAVGLTAAAVGIALLVGPTLVAAAAIYELWQAGKGAWDYLAGIQWGQLGTNLIDGLVGGIESGAAAVTNAVEGLADKAKSAFKDALGIHSPSRVFDDYGNNGIAAGAVQGIEKGTPDVEAAASSMAGAAADGGSMSAPSVGGTAGGSGAGRGSSAPITVVINIDASGAGPEQVKRLQDPSLMAPFLKNFEQILLQMGYSANA